MLFEELGAEVIVSSNTTKELIDKGIKVSVPEICVPIKIFNGHILELLDEEVDFLFIPRMMSLRKGEYFCPKFMGLPDMIRYGIPKSEGKILQPNIYSVTDDISGFRNFKPLLDTLGVSEYRMKAALKKARIRWRESRSLSVKGYTALEVIDGMVAKPPANKPDPFMLNIGLLGYVYNLYDEFVSMQIVDRLKEKNIKVKTFEMFDEKILDNQLQGMKKRLFWTFSNKLLAAGYKFFQDPSIDGLIHITAFGCGPDSLIGKIMELESVNYNKPFMTIRIDEHTGENHLLTRVEAFIDMIYRKKVMSKREA